MPVAAASVPRPRVGEYLRRLRGEKNMSLEEAATRLFLQSHVLKALERDDHANLPDVYLRGHLRNYARLLGAAPEKILAMYREDLAGPKEEAAPPPPPAPAQPSACVAADSCLVALALAVFTWWLGVFILERTTPAAGGAAAPPRPASPPPPRLDYVITPVEHPAAPFYQAPAEEAAAGDDMVTTGQGPDTIRMTLTEDSWIEVLDADNEKVYYDLGRAGQTLVLNGAAPFSVLLGASRGVTLEFNGAPFNVIPYSSRNNLARFVLGE